MNETKPFDESKHRKPIIRNMCGACLAFHWESVDQEDAHGTCHRCSPSCGINDEAVFPIVSIYDWCMDFKPLEPGQVSAFDADYPEEADGEKSTACDIA